MTIHTDHPFVPPEGERDQLRRMRGRLASPVTVWAAGSGPARRGLTVSSFLVADGEPGQVLGLIDADSDLWESSPQTVVVNVLGAEHRFLADAFAGTAPAPGGPFTLGEWSDSEWGPVLTGGAGWIGVRLAMSEPREVGWGLLVHGDVEHVSVGDAEPLIHLRGRYRTAPGA
ncbi:flavin reductase family protein [Aeromicrobium sp.]|uniref:flavin reductase family protein n=1 Tax=Aeromicrobium sp. TaxID=1871063 RepID=UPI0019B904E7|nr:flavin reductase family protein [Aeromicrobium sp.]MBC7633246.1 flavin reductase [Aeromicrobium sp.]